MIPKPNLWRNQVPTIGGNYWIKKLQKDYGDWTQPESILIAWWSPMESEGGVIDEELQDQMEWDSGFVLFSKIGIEWLLGPRIPSPEELERLSHLASIGKRALESWGMFPFDSSIK